MSDQDVVMADMRRMWQERQQRMDVLALAVQARSLAPPGVPTPNVWDEIHDPHVLEGDATEAVVPKRDAAKGMTLETKI